MQKFLAVLILVCMGSEVFSWDMEDILKNMLPEGNSCEMGSCGESSLIVNTIAEVLAPALEKCLESESTQELFLCVAYEHGIIDDDANFNAERLGLILLQLINPLIESYGEDIFAKLFPLEGPQLTNLLSKKAEESLASSLNQANVCYRDGACS